MWATMIAVVPYPSELRWGFPILVGLYRLTYQYLVARDVRPPRVFDSVSLRWFVLGFVAGSAGFHGAIWFVDTFTVPLVARMGTLGLVPFQAAIGLMLFQSAQGLRGRHSVLVSMIGIVTTGLAVMASHVFMFASLEPRQMWGLIQTRFF